MSDLLAIIGSEDTDREVIDAVAAYRPTRVTVLVRSDDGERIGEDTPESEILRDRLARLMAAVEQRTGATVVGMAGDRDQLAGWRFDREVEAPLPLAA